MKYNTSFGNTTDLTLSWQVGYSAHKEQLPQEFIPSVVPGAVQLDIARAANYPDINYADNYKMFDWAEDMHYTYRTTFPAPTLIDGERLWFVSKGIDYKFEISFNGKKIHSQEGMFSYVELDLTSDLQAENHLEILVMPVPKRFPLPNDRTQAANVVKPAVSYLWDWHPRLVPLGIWDDTGLQVRRSTHLNDVWVDYTLNEDLSAADIEVNVRATVSETTRYRWTLTDADGVQVLADQGTMQDNLTIRRCIQAPQLWWCHDHGTPYLYESTFEILNSDNDILSCEQSKIGFRRIRLVMNEGAWNEPKGFPKGRSVAPAQIELNGRNIFAKGSNWVNPEIFPGTITADRYRELLEMCVASNFNILRSWGGGIINKSSFFELCDSMGILVWQEFPLACNNYPDEDHYLTILEQEAEAIIKRLRKHACIAIWCGGNELFNNWSGMTDQSWALRLLGALCYRLDRKTPFNPTSPMYGMAHGHYVFCWHGEEVFKMMNESHCTAYTEFGISGISPKSVLEKIIPDKEMFPPKAGTAWEEHHAFGAWDGDMETWLCQHLLTDYFGAAQTLDELIEQSSTLQSEGYKAIYEEARRQKPYCSMALNWCLNEPWPSAANNSLIVYPAVAKPALKAVSGSCRPVCASARITKFVWHEDEYFASDIWILNDAFERIGNLKVTVTLIVAGRRIAIMEWDAKELNPNENMEGPTARYKLPAFDSNTFKLSVQVEGHQQYDSEYTLVYKRKISKVVATVAMNVTE